MHGCACNEKMCNYTVRLLVVFCACATAHRMFANYSYRDGLYANASNALYAGAISLDGGFQSNPRGGLFEPNPPRNSPFPPLDRSIFSVYGYKFTFAYKHPEIDLVQTMDGVFWRDGLASDIHLRVKQLMEKTRVHFYESAPWFDNHRTHIKQFVAWCDQNTGGDYYLTENTLYNYMEYAIKSRKEQVKAKQTAAADLPERTVQNYVKLVVATMQRLAMWQGVEQYSKDLTKQSPFATLYNDAMKTAEGAAATKPIDYETINRSISKRIQVSCVYTPYFVYKVTNYCWIVCSLMSARGSTGLCSLLLTASATRLDGCGQS